jgi:hypothetical protein
MVKNYLQFIKESDEVNKPDSSKFSEVTDEVKSMVEKTIEKSGGELKTFVESFIKNPEDIKVEGFINDSDVYDFYLKWRNDIDEILSSIKFFSEVPTDNNAFGLYEYVIKGTQRSFLEFIKMIK